jgi:hypothetical protein
MRMKRAMILAPIKAVINGVLSRKNAMKTAAVLRKSSSSRTCLMVVLRGRVACCLAFFFGLSLHHLGVPAADRGSVGGTL